MTARSQRSASSRASAVVACWLLAAACSGCDGLLGGVELADGEPPASTAPTFPQLVLPPLQPQPGAPAPVPQPTRPELPGGETPLLPEPAEGDAGSADAGATLPPPPPPPPPPRPVDVEPPSPLGLVGFEGGGPRLGTCQDGILIGIRPTANPSTDTFGQRLVFLEPICARATLLATATAPARLELTRDDALLSWDATEPLLGPPTWEVPDERLVWVPQPETLCPAAAPAVVGLSGAYDPPAEDGSATASIRSLVLECAPLAVASDGSEVAAVAEGHLLVSRPDSFSAPGPAQYRSACEGGSVLSQLLVHSGFWLDGFVLGCSQLHGE